MIESGFGVNRRNAFVSPVLPIVVFAFSLLLTLGRPMIRPPSQADRFPVSQEDLAQHSELKLRFSGVHAFKREPENPLEMPTWVKVEFSFPGFAMTDDMSRPVHFPLSWKGNSFSLDYSGFADEINLYSEGRTFAGEYSLKATGTVDLEKSILLDGGFSWMVRSLDERNHVACAFQVSNIPVDFAVSTVGQTLKFAVHGPGAVCHMSGISGMYCLKDWRMGTYQNTDWTGLRPAHVRQIRQAPSLIVTLFRK
jgi:hypothetical protein